MASYNSQPGPYMMANPSVDIRRNGGSLTVWAFRKVVEDARSNWTAELDTSAGDGAVSCRGGILVPSSTDAG